MKLFQFFTATTTPLPRLDFDAQLFAGKITQTSALISWKTFTDEEMKYIDGIQVKYKAADKEVILIFYTNYKFFSIINEEFHTLL